MRPFLLIKAWISLSAESPPNCSMYFMHMPAKDRSWHPKTWDWALNFPFNMKPPEVLMFRICCEAHPMPLWMWVSTEGMVLAYQMGLCSWAWRAKDFFFVDLREASDIFTVIIYYTFHIWWIYGGPGKSLLYLHKSTINKAHFPSSTHHIVLELEEVNIGPGKYNILCLWTLPIFLTFIIFQHFISISIIQLSSSLFFFLKSSAW